jgi:steroid delta-isomerase-like uncharacterized protein
LADSEAVVIARRWHQDLYRQGVMEAAEEICASDMVAHGTGVAPDAPRGPRFVQEDAAAVRAAFSIESLTDDDVIASGDKVVIRWTFHGIHVGPFMGVPATGRRVKIEGIDIFRIANGKIAEFWSGYDLLDLAQMVGAVPELEEV